MKKKLLAKLLMVNSEMDKLRTVHLYWLKSRWTYLLGQKQLLDELLNCKS